MKKISKVTIAAAFGALVGGASLIGTRNAEFEPGYCLFDPNLGTASIFDESDSTATSIHLRNPRRLENDSGYSGDTSVMLSAQPLSGQWKKITVRPDGGNILPEAPVCELLGANGEKRLYEAIETELPDFRPMLTSQP